MLNVSLKPEDFKRREAEVAQVLGKKRESVYARFPLLFTLLSTFGLVATYYGFEHIIDNIKFLSDNPFILLALGVSTLWVTGALYRKLG